MCDYQSVRPAFEKNVAYVDEFLVGKGIDAGCGSCPLMKEDCVHVDISPQPYAVDQVGNAFYQGDATKLHYFGSNFDYVFSSHMVEDLGSKEEMVACLRNWTNVLKLNGYIILLIPDMQGGRYPKVGEPGGNCSHKIDVGIEFVLEIITDLPELEIIQMNTIPYDESETLDVVFQKVNNG